MWAHSISASSRDPCWPVDTEWVQCTLQSTTTTDCKSYSSRVGSKILFRRALSFWADKKQKKKKKNENRSSFYQAWQKTKKKIKWKQKKEHPHFPKKMRWQEEKGHHSLPGDGGWGTKFTNAWNNKYDSFKTYFRGKGTCPLLPPPPPDPATSRH